MYEKYSTLGSDLNSFRCIGWIGNEMMRKDSEGGIMVIFMFLPLH